MDWTYKEIKIWWNSANASDPCSSYSVVLTSFSERVKIRILRTIILPLLCVLGNSRSESNGKEELVLKFAWKMIIKVISGVT